eukprot:COSAG06_NODE_5878_length_3231_cov_2.531609_3_plen_30_part_00
MLMDAMLLGGGQASPPEFLRVFKEIEAHW